MLIFHPFLPCPAFRVVLLQHLPLHAKQYLEAMHELYHIDYIHNDTKRENTMRVITSSTVEQIYLKLMPFQLNMYGFLHDAMSGNIGNFFFEITQLYVLDGTNEKRSQ